MRRFAVLAFWFVPLVLSGQAPASPPQPPAVTVLRPARVFDGDTMHEGWAVRVRGDRIESAGPAASISSSGATALDLPGTTLMPGLVEGTRTCCCTPTTRRRGTIRCCTKASACALPAPPTICVRR